MYRYLLLILCALIPGGRLAAQTEDRSYDLIVYGATPGGIACAVRAAREGLQVLLVTHAQHVGGMSSNGISLMDTLYNGFRAPFYDEFRQSIYDYYRKTYGADSEQYKATLPNFAKTRFEAHVMERLFEGLLQREPAIKVVRRHYPLEARRHLRELQSVVFREMGGARTLTASGAIFADCSYEGDLLAIAKVPYAWGREAREEFNEEHAGRLFMLPMPWPPPHIDPAYFKEYRRLNLIHYERWYEIAHPHSTGAADRSVQAYNMRTVVTRNPVNRVPIQKPAGYDRAELLRRLAHDINLSGPGAHSLAHASSLLGLLSSWHRAPATPDQPNAKKYLNLPELVGVQNAYVEGDWPTRQRIIDEHVRITLSLLYFLQNDPEVPEETRRSWREWGLPRDEFPDNGHVPYEVYVREARRLKGRHIYTENDSRLARGLKRAPVHADSITATEWFLDSHACTPERVPGSLWEGELLLNNITQPGQVPYRSLLPHELDNLLVPVCASSSHIGWGALRLEPTWMSLSDAAAHAAVLARRQRKPPAEIDPDELVRWLAEKRVLISFFNDVEVDPREPWVPGVQYFGTKGFFGTYDAMPGAPLKTNLAKAWAAAAAEIAVRADVDCTDRARRMLAAETSGGEDVAAGDFLRWLNEARAKAAGLGSLDATLLRELSLSSSAPLTRGAACRLMFAAVLPAKASPAEARKSTTNE